VTEHPDEPTAPRSRNRLVALAIAATLAVAVVVAVVLSRSAPEDRTGSRTGAAEPAAVAAPTTPVAVEAEAVPTTTLPAPEDLRAEAELAEVAALLDTPLVLSSPAQWDQWLPEGKPYPGASTEEDMATCPRLSDRLGAALGVGMSYWTGTLPQGPVGCTWATVPLSYDGPYDYAYTASVGFLADGTTTEELRQGFYHRRGEICPGIDVPSAGAGAVLVRCEAADGIEYVVALRDSRTDGVWVVMSKAQSDEPHPTTDVLTTVMAGVAETYG
jgi:hypothetical protein